MSSADYEIQIMAKSPFVRTLALAVIRNILSHQISYDEKHVIDAELVPRVSEKVALASLKEGKTEKLKESEKELTRHIPVVPQPLPPPARAPGLPAPRTMPFQIAPPIRTGGGQAMGGGVTGDYGKITPLLNDPSVSSIECSGSDKTVTIIRAGQRQFTKITLNQEEIKNILETIAEQAHIPLMEGVFRAAVENFSINGVVSEMVGSRFVIKKFTPYAMLE
tara:strand:- start:668 stop:1330 length:663 start_codon:yes stop_codon:yes gene_type:complete